MHGKCHGAGRLGLRRGVATSCREVTVARPPPIRQARRLHSLPFVTWHHFTVDVEEYFQVSSFEHVVPRSRWGSMESRVTASVHRMLDLLAQYEARATFFVVGWVAEHHPDLVRTIADAGHEIASHTWDHAKVTEQTSGEFRRSVRRSRLLLEDLAQAPVVGFRAPSFSIVRGREWALDVLLEEGYRYDSSLFPVRRPGYGYAGGRRAPHVLTRPGGYLLEFPPSTLRWMGMNIPAAGGAYFRCLPYSLVRAAFRQSERQGRPGTFYIHPWELDAAQPRLATSHLTRLRHYTGLSRTEARLHRLLADFRFSSIARTVKALWEPASSAR